MCVCVCVCFLGPWLKLVHVDTPASRNAGKCSLIQKEMVTQTLVKMITFSRLHRVGPQLWESKVR